MKRMRLNTSPKVLATSASTGLFSATTLYTMIINDSLFRGDYLMPLPFAGFTFIISFFLVWVLYSLRLAGRHRLSVNPSIVRLVGPEQAAILAQLQSTGRWSMVFVFSSPTYSILLRGKGVRDAHLPDLAGLQLVTSLNLADCPVTDSGLVALKSLKQLGALGLSGTKITDAGLDHLKGFPSLLRLDVDKTAVTYAGLRTAGLIEKRFGAREMEQEKRLAGSMPFPPKGCDLRLMSPVDVVSGLPTAGKSRVIVAAVRNVLHFRIFDRDGQMVVDTDETNLTIQARAIEALRKKLASLWPPHDLTENETASVIVAVTLIVGHTPQEYWLIWGGRKRGRS